ncbi:MAG: multiheme c-type cytochrome [Thermoleophilia bacterium]
MAATRSAQGSPAAVGNDIRRTCARLLVLGCVAVVLTLAVAGPASAAVGDDEPVCVTCHTSVSLEVVTSWRSQNHGRNGVSCEVCHNTHDREFRAKPTTEVCMGCHDVESIHQGFLPETPAERCMDCHTSNVHLYPGQASWFYSGLPPEKLEGGEDPGPQIAGSTGRAAGVAGAVVTVVFGLLAGLLIDRFVRNL